MNELSCGCDLLPRFVWPNAKESGETEADGTAAILWDHSERRRVVEGEGQIGATDLPDRLKLARIQPHRGLDVGVQPGRLLVEPWEFGDRLLHEDVGVPCHALAQRLVDAGFGVQDGEQKRPKPLRAAASSPVRADHQHVDRVHHALEIIPLELEPVIAALVHVVARLQVLDDQPFGVPCDALFQILPDPFDGSFLVDGFIRVNDNCRGCRRGAG